MKKTVVNTYNKNKKKYEITRIICENSEHDSFHIEFHIPNAKYPYVTVKEDKKVFKQSEPILYLKSPFFDTILGKPWSI